MARGRQWDKLLHGLRQQVRQLSREVDPRRALATHSRCVRAVKGTFHGYCAGKQVAGRKRPVAVDTLGLPLAVLVQPASMQDSVGAAPVLGQAKACAPNLQVLWADARPQGPLVATATAALRLRNAPPLGRGAKLQLVEEVPPRDGPRLRT